MRALNSVELTQIAGGYFIGGVKELSERQEHYLTDPEKVVGTISVVGTLLTVGLLAKAKIPLAVGGLIALAVGGWSYFSNGQDEQMKVVIKT